MRKIFRSPLTAGLAVLALAAGCAESDPAVNDTYKIASMLTVCPADPWHDGMGLLTYTLDVVKLLDTNTLDSEALITKAMYVCMTGAKDCATFNLCYQPSAEKKTQACTAGLSSVCSDGSLIRCTGDEFPPLEMCFDAGLSCITLGTSAECGIEECPAGKAPYCEGDKLFECKAGSSGTGGALILRDCRHEGGTCGQKAGGGYDCIGTGAACTNEGQLACDGQYVTSCMNGFGTKYDCKKLDKTYTCKPSSMLGAACLAETSDCDRQTNESCADGTITFCYFGRTSKLNCKDYGFTGCGTTVGDSKQTVAFCSK